MKNDKKALIITEKAKDNIFVNCDVESAQIDGRGTVMIKTRIYNFKKNYPNIWTGVIIPLFVTIAGGIILLLIERNLKFIF